MSFWRLEPILCFKKKKSRTSWVLPDLISNEEGKFGGLTRTDTADVLAFVAVSDSSKMVKYGRLLCSPEIQVHPFCCYCSSQRPGFETNFVCSESSGLKCCLR